MVISTVQVSFYRQQYAKVIADKHEQSIAKFGAILAQGIIDAGMYVPLFCCMLYICVPMIVRGTKCHCQFKIVCWTYPNVFGCWTVGFQSVLVLVSTLSFPVPGICSHCHHWTQS